MAEDRGVAVELKALVLDIDCQPRAELNNEAVAEYAELLRDDATLPPVKVVDVDGDLVVIDGFHRIAAAMQAGHTFIRAIVVDNGNVNDARWHAAAMNQVHGVRRTSADKRAAVKLALKVAGDDRSNRDIARHCGVSHTFVNNVLKELEVEMETVSIPEQKPDEPEPESPAPKEDEPEPDMYVTAGKVIRRAYQKVCKILGDNDDVCEALFKAIEAAEQREL